MLRNKQLIHSDQTTQKLKHQTKLKEKHSQITNSLKYERTMNLITKKNENVTVPHRTTLSE